MTFENFTIETDSGGIALVTFDVPGKSMNTITGSVMRELSALAETIKNDSGIKGAVITSGKTNGFCAGADLEEINQNIVSVMAKAATREERAKAILAATGGLSRGLRAIESCGKPVACALNGLALGGGLELALACHYRVAADDPRIQLGLPETKVGLMPGGGGTQRLVRLIGAMAALPLILQGKSVSPGEAQSMGIVHEVAKPGHEVAAAKKWIAGGGRAAQPWDDPDYRVPGGLPYSKTGAQVFIGANALLHKETSGNYPAPENALRAVYEGLLVPFDTALRIEARYFAKTLLDPRSTAMVRTLFLSLQELNKGARRPKAVPPAEIRKLGVLGAGMMGAGIAYVSAYAGIAVTLLDTTQEAAEKGKAHSAALMDKQIARGKADEAKKKAVLGLIAPATDFGALKGCDLVIEAVFESREVKNEVIKKAEAQLGQEAVFGSNTSTLPITGLAEASARPENFIGIHFFSPVEKMGLVEIILGKKTGERALATAMDYVRKIKKTPIVVNDARGFYTSRCFSTYIAEGVEMLAEGIPPALIDNAGRMTGMPRGPLEVGDDVALDLSWKIREQTRKDLGTRFEASAIDGILETLVVKLGRLGRKNGKGFYEYPADGKKYLWPGLADIAKPKIFDAEPAFVAELKKRLLYRQALEAARCVEEGVIADTRDADVGAILGWGFAPWTGGPLSLIDTVGLKTFAAECERMAKAYGKRFAPNALLRAMAERGETFYGRAGGRKAA